MINISRTSSRLLTKPSLICSILIPPRQNNLLEAIPMADLVSSEKEKTCPECGNIVVQRPHTKPRRFCSTRCRHRWYINHPELMPENSVHHFVCAKCRQPFITYGNKKRKYCSHECYIIDRFYTKNWYDF